MLSMLVSIMAQANESALVAEKEINNWGYITLGYESNINNGVVTKTQSIKSIKEAPGMKNHYYYYNLSQECYTNIVSAMKRKLSLLFLSEKDYRRSELSGKCVQVIETSANFSTFKEQPRVFLLFNNYLSNEST